MVERREDEVPHSCVSSPRRAGRSAHDICVKQLVLLGGTTFFCHFFWLFGYLAFKRITFIDHDQIGTRAYRFVDACQPSLETISQHELGFCLCFFLAGRCSHLHPKCHRVSAIGEQVSETSCLRDPAKASKVFKKRLHATALARYRQPCRFHTSINISNQYVSSNIISYFSLSVVYRCVLRTAYWPVRKQLASLFIIARDLYSGFNLEHVYLFNIDDVI